MVHQLLESVAEEAHQEGDGLDALCHAKLLHHGVGNAGDLRQVILSSVSDLIKGDDSPCATTQSHAHRSHS